MLPLSTRDHRFSANPPPQDPANKTGIFRHPSLGLIINRMWFKKRTDDGVKDAAFSLDNGIPIPTIALVYTASFYAKIECILDSWTTGKWNEHNSFAAEVYRERYDRHLRMLKDFEKKTSEKKILPRIRAHLLSKARKYANVEEPSSTGAVIANIDYEAAMADWDENKLSDDESGNASTSGTTTSA
ncbi:hypothetical protein NMY22_g16265 [Coprinellus aureogranulatus]|nr:hypothetical protein NMY22_g16265 [Coprinellus aureogranulatus]